MRDIHVEEIQCKTILNKSVMPFADYTLNAYLGCAFGCSYCYVPVMRARRGQVDDEKWGGWVQVKMNAPDVLRRQMLRVPPEARLSIGTATDSWQPVEKRYEISRRILTELAYYPNPVHLLTRSPLLIRDIDILQRMENIRIGVSLPTFDDDVRRTFEPYAPAIPGRVNLVKRLLAAGLDVRLFWSPVLYGVMDNRDAVRDYLRRAADLGVQHLMWSTLNYAETLWKPHLTLLNDYRKTASDRPKTSLSREELAHEIKRWSAEYGIDCGG